MIREGDPAWTKALPPPVKTTQPANAEDFYDDFKEALKYLGPGWFGKKEITVKGFLVLMCNGRTVTIEYSSR